VECIEDAIIARSLAGVILTWSRAADTPHDCSDGEAIGRYVPILVAPEQLPRPLYITNQALQVMPSSNTQVCACAKAGLSEIDSAEPLQAPPMAVQWINMLRVASQRHAISLPMRSRRDCRQLLK
jgi:hypothetical protein